MTQRFMRDYQVVIHLPNGSQEVIRPPLEITFNCSHATQGGMNKMNLKVKNIRPSVRPMLVRDVADAGKLIKLELYVGYNAELKLLFKGTVMRGRNDRAGADIETTFECIDGGFDQQYSFTSKVVKGKEQAVDAILADMPNTTKGKVTALEKLSRAKVMVGNSVQLIRDTIHPDDEFFIENEQLFIMKRDEVKTSFIPIVSAATGLLNTPQKQSNVVKFKTMMNPTLQIGGLCELKSTINPGINGIYRVQAINTDGDYEGSDWSQDCTAFGVTGYRVL